MAKYFQRFGSEKKDFIVSVRVVSFSADVSDKTFFSVVWKRGPHADETSVFSIDSEEKGAQIN
jgi:hypothetical protein